MSKPHLIAFTGLAQSGKTTAAKFLWSYHLFSFADPLRQMLAVLTHCKDKNTTPEELCGRTVRYALQTLGTEWGRNTIGKDIWVEYTRRRIKEHLRENGWGWGEENGAVIDDLRFDDEAKMIRQEGGKIVHIYRPGLERMNHESENGIDPTLVDYWVSATTVDELTGELVKIGIVP